MSMRKHNKCQSSECRSCMEFQKL